MANYLVPNAPINLIPSTAATADITGGTFEVRKGNAQGNIGMQVIGTGLNSADSSVKIQQSNDGVNWLDLAGSSLTLAAGTATQITTPITNCAMAYYRVNFAHGTNSAGTVQVIFNLS